MIRTKITLPLIILVSLTIQTYKNLTLKTTATTSPDVVHSFCRMTHMLSATYAMTVCNVAR